MEKVLIVGGGCAGLTAAYTLKKNGYDVSIYEAGSHIGGRMHIWEKDGFIVDEYAQFVHPGYRIAREMISDEFKLDLHPFELGAGARLWFNDKWVAAFPNPNDGQALADTKEWIDYMGEDNFNNFVATVEKYCKDRMYEGSVDWMLDVDKANAPSFGEYVSNNFGSPLLEVFAQPILAAIGLEYPERVGIGFGLQIAWTVLVGGAAVVKKGLGQLATGMTETLDPAKIHLKTAVEEIVIENGKAAGIRIKSGDFVAADKVVCAVPATHALGMLPGLPGAMRSAMETVTYCPTIHASLFFDKKLTDGNLVCCLLPRSTKEPFCSFLYQSGRSKWMLPDDNSDSISAFFYGEGADAFWNKSEDEIAAETLRVVRKYKPETPEKALFYHVVKAPIANYTMRNGTPTAIKELRDKHYKDVCGLYLAAEYMYTGSYESAIAAGRRAADVVMGKAEHI
jgi:protoporphyrinogen oxidase